MLGLPKIQRVKGILKAEGDRNHQDPRKLPLPASTDSVECASARLQRLRIPAAVRRPTPSRLGCVALLVEVNPRSVTRCCQSSGATAASSIVASGSFTAHGGARSSVPGRHPRTGGILPSIFARTQLAQSRDAPDAGVSDMSFRIHWKTAHVASRSSSLYLSTSPTRRCASSRSSALTARM